MLTAWDSETETVIPTSSAVVSASKGESSVLSDKQLWSMLSQNMGVHFGDNVELDGDGTYDVSVDFGPVGTRLSGALAALSTDQQSFSIEIPFEQATLDEVMFDLLDDRKGERDALDPMEMGMRPTGQVPEPSALPGQLLGDETSGDAAIVATVLDSVPAGIDGEGAYLAVSARTPYNRYPLPFMSLSATISRDGEAIFEGDLTDTIHPDIGYHYGTVVDGVQSGDTVDIAIDAPPQIARHEGYETAFLSMDAISLTA
jgi:hypothetical protein